MPNAECQMPKMSTLATVALSASQCVSGPSDGLRETLLVHLDADEIDAQLRAGHRRAPRRSMVVRPRGAR
jgi:hypothetical protein